MLLVVTYQAQKLSFAIFVVLLRAQQGNNEENKSRGIAGLSGRCRWLYDMIPNIVDFLAAPNT